MNGEQMEFLARELADGLTSKMKPVFELSDRQADAVQTALVLAWLEGFGRGQKATQAIAHRVLDQAIEKLVRVQSKAGV